MAEIKEPNKKIESSGALNDTELDKVSGGTVADNFAELPMEGLIANPLDEVVESQRNLTQTYIDVLERITK